MSNTTLGVYFLQALEKILTCLHLGSHYFCIYTSCKSKFILCLPIQSRPFKMQILFLLGAWRLYRCWALMNSPLYKIYSILTLKEIRLKNIYSFERQIDERRKRKNRTFIHCLIPQVFLHGCNSHGWVRNSIWVFLCGQQEARCLGHPLPPSRWINRELTGASTWNLHQMLWYGIQLNPLHHN